MGAIRVSARVSREIYKDGMAAFRDPAHPCHPFVLWQRKHGCSEFQLPEPFSGRRSTLGLVFVGLNPGFTVDADMPTARAKTPFEEYDAFYRKRFEDKNRDEHSRLFSMRNGDVKKLSRFWNGLEGFCREWLTDEFRLGEHAILIQVVRYKSKGGWLGVPGGERRRAIACHERRMTRKLLEDLRPKVVVAVGGKALRELHNMLNFEDEPPPRVKDAVGKTFAAQLLGKRLTICATKHFAYPMRLDQQRLAAAPIREALRSVFQSKFISPLKNSYRGVP
jgi:uracil-DNA glycosylase